MCKEQVCFHQSVGLISSSLILASEKGGEDMASASPPVLVLLSCPNIQQHRSPGWTYAAQPASRSPEMDVSGHLDRSHLLGGISRVGPDTAIVLLTDLPT